MTVLPPYVIATGASVLLRLRASPGAKKRAFAGTWQGSLRVRIGAPAVDGKANKALLKFLASTLGVAKSDLEISRGHGGRDKTVTVRGLDAAVVAERLRVAGAE